MFAGSIAGVFYAFSYEWSLPLLSFYTGIIVFLELSEAFEITSPTITLVLTLIFGFSFASVAKRYQGPLKRIGTAFIGSFFMIKGIGTWFGGYPDID